MNSPWATLFNLCTGSGGFGVAGAALFRPVALSRRSFGMRAIPLLLCAVLLVPLFADLAAAAAKQTPVERLVAEFNALEQDAKRGGRRDLWLALEKNAAALQAKSKGGQAAVAAFYRARARQELGNRSFLASDHLEAVKLFGAVANAYPNHATAPESLLRQATVLRDKLADRQETNKTLKRLIRSYPKTQEAARAKEMLAGTAETAGKKAASPKSGSASVMEQLGLTVQTIMLDAGHGGKDPGAMAGGIVERQFVLSMAKRVGALLEKKGFTVLYTRTGNTYISLQDRPDIANGKKADLFISFHINANNNPNIRGLETYYLDEAKTQDAAVVAARENAVSVKNINDLQVILTDLMLSYKVKESRHLAQCVHRGILRKVRASGLAAHDNGVRSAPFYVLMGARMPAILVEFGYITNKGDLASLKSEAYLQRQAEGLVEGVLLYRAELAKMVPQ